MSYTLVVSKETLNKLRKIWDDTPIGINSYAEALDQALQDRDRLLDMVTSLMAEDGTLTDAEIEVRVKEVLLARKP